MKGRDGASDSTTSSGGIVVRAPPDFRGWFPQGESCWKVHSDALESDHFDKGDSILFQVAQLV
jgi:hypothetical protein